MAAKTECDRCKMVFDSMEDRSMCVSMIIYGKVEDGNGTYANLDFCPECTALIDMRLKELFDDNTN